MSYVYFESFKINSFKINKSAHELNIVWFVCILNEPHKINAAFQVKVFFSK